MFDGNEHSIYLDGDIPVGLQVEYINNNKVAACTYEVIANFIEEDGYKDLPNMSAKMTILKTDI